jgi:hypothetical protein
LSAVHFVQLVSEKNWAPLMKQATTYYFIRSSRRYPRSLAGAVVPNVAPRSPPLRSRARRTHLCPFPGFVFLSSPSRSHARAVSSSMRCCSCALTHFCSSTTPAASFPFSLVFISLEPVSYRLVSYRFSYQLLSYRLVSRSLSTASSFVSG